MDKMTYMLSCFVSSQLMLTSKQPVEKVFLLLRIKNQFLSSHQKFVSISSEFYHQ